MKRSAWTQIVAGLAAAFVGSSHAAGQTVPTTFVGHPGNPGYSVTPDGFGAVGYEYRIGVYEVTHAQYAAFLTRSPRRTPTACTTRA